MSEDIIEGRCCELCMKYFISSDGKSIFEYGYPVTCKTCWQRLSGKEKERHIKAE